MNFSSPIPVTSIATKSDSPFIAPVAVEAWDAWFRWRDNGELRDLTVEDTWNRVTNFVARNAANTGGTYRRRLLNAFSRWQLLLDPRVLANARTGNPDMPQQDPVAALNLATFVASPLSPRASFDHASFAEIAALAVRALEDVSARGFQRLRIGVIGFGDALALLGVAYDSAQALTHAAAIARTLARGCLRASVDLARDRGQRYSFEDCRLHQHANSGELDADVIADARNFGVRHQTLTAIASHPQLARFANDVSDALDPVSWPCAQRFACAGGKRCMDSVGYSRSLARLIGRPSPELAAGASVAAQLRVRAAMQPWIDEPISYPVPVTNALEERTAEEHAAAALAAGLPGFSWRLCDTREAADVSTTLNTAQ